MNDSIKKVCFLVSLIAVSILGWEMSSYGQQNVQVVKDDFGVELRESSSLRREAT